MMRIKSFRAKVRSLFSNHYNRFIKYIKAKYRILLIHVLQPAKVWISRCREKFISRLNNIFGLAPQKIRQDIREIRKALSLNEAFLRNRWGWFERLIVWSSKHVFRAVVFLLVIFVLLFVLLAILFTILISEQSSFLMGWQPISDLPSTIFRAQITMLGIIFPVIIGFVAILLQGKPHNEPIWDIYKNNSGFMFAIFSFLTLSIIFVFYELLISRLMSDQFSIAASISIACWFIVNLVLSGWFFWKTILFLSPSRRLEMVAKYIINEMPPYIRWASQYYLSIPKHFVRPDQLFLSIFSDVEATLKDNNSIIFREAKKNIVGFYKEIIFSMSLRGPDNLLQFPVVARRGATYIDIFIGKAHKISKSVIREIHEDEDYYYIWCDFYINLFGILGMKTPEEVVKKYIKTHYMIWEELMEYISSNNLIKEKRKRIIVDYINSWNKWTQKLIIRDIGNERLIDTLSFSCVKEHLNKTSCMLINAVVYGNFESAEQVANILIKWFEAFSRDNRDDVVYSRYAYMNWEGSSQLPADSITLTCMKDKNIDVYLDKINAVVRKPNEKQASTIALMNYWIDIRCVTAAYLMNSPKYLHNEWYRRSTCNILDYEDPDEEPYREIQAERQYYNSISSIKDILNIYLRQIYEDDYSSYILAHYKELVDIKKSTWEKFAEAGSPGIVESDYLFDKHILPLYQVIGIGLARYLSDLESLSKWKDVIKSKVIPSETLDTVISKLEKLTEVDDLVIHKVCYQFSIEPTIAHIRCRHFIGAINYICKDWNDSDNRTRRADI